MIPSLHVVSIPAVTISDLVNGVNEKLKWLEKNPKVEGDFSELYKMESALTVVVNYMNAQFEASLTKQLEEKKERVKKEPTIRQLWNSVNPGEKVDNAGYVELVNYITENSSEVFGNNTSVQCYWDRMPLCWNMTVEQARIHVDGVIKRRIEWNRAMR